MPQKINEPDYEKAAELLAKLTKDASRDFNFGPGSRVPIGWVIGAVIPIIVATIWTSSLIADFRSQLKETVTVSWMRSYGKEAHLLNTTWSAPEVDEIQAKQKSK